MPPADDLTTLATDLVFADLANAACVSDLRVRLALVEGPAAVAAQEAAALLAGAPGADPEALRTQVAEAVDRAQQAMAAGGLVPPTDMGADPARHEFLARAPDALADIAHLLDQWEGGDPVVPDLRRAIHTVKGEAGALDLRGIAQVLHAAEDALQRTDDLLTLVPPVRAAFDWVSSRIDDARTGEPPAPAPAHLLEALTIRVPTLGEVLVGTGRITRQEADAALAAQQLDPGRRLGEILVDAGKVEPHDVAEALQRQRPLEPRPHVAQASVRVDAGRVDALYDAVGELVIAQSILAAAPEVQALGSRRVRALMAQVERTTAAIQELSFRLRLVPVKALLQRTARVARETARTVGRDIDVVLVGEDQELDRAVVDRLGEPLLHLVRNAVDHGIECPDDRAAVNKPRVGRLTLAAINHGGTFRIEVSDDGRGLSRERILAKARQQGLIGPEDLPDEDVWNLIFRPGFSTAEIITDVSGRGVGLDAVRSAVDGLRGQIRVETTPGAGSRFTVQLPPTLAIIDGLAVRAGGRDYVLPTLSVVATARLDDDAVTSVAGRGRLVGFQGRQLTLIDMADFFGHPVEAAVRPLVVIIENGQHRCALRVDAVLGRQHIVLKQLGGGLPPVPGIGGATIAADGRPGLVVDVPALLMAALGDGRAATQVPYPP